MDLTRQETIEIASQVLMLLKELGFESKLDEGQIESKEFSGWVTPMILENALQPSVNYGVGHQQFQVARMCCIVIALYPTDHAIDESLLLLDSFEKDSIHRIISQSFLRSLSKGQSLKEALAYQGNRPLVLRCLAEVWRLATGKAIKSLPNSRHVRPGFRTLLNTSLQERLVQIRLVEIERATGE